MINLPILESSSQIQAMFRDQKSLLLLLQEMNDGVLIVDEAMQILLYNQALKRLLDLNETVLNQPCAEVIQSQELQDGIALVLQSGKSVTQELTLMRGNLKQYFQVHLVPLVMTDGIDGCVAIFQDMTAIRRTEKMRRDFVANVSHELRTPLSAINGYAETLLDGALDDPEVARDFVRVIFRHSQRLSQLVADLLDLSKLESMDFEPELGPVTLKPLIHKVHSLVGPTVAAKNLMFFIHLPDDLPKVLANLSNLEQVITNLVDNAVKYTPEGGTVAVSAFETDNGMLQVNISDTGIGIEAKHIPRLFERFYRVDKARSREMGGTGLGLSIVKHIVQYHGGDIWVESAVNKGSTFSFTLQKLPE